MDDLKAGQVQQLLGFFCLFNGNCIGFKVAPSSANDYENQLIIPYSEDYDRDSLENN